MVQAMYAPPTQQQQQQGAAASMPEEVAEGLAWDGEGAPGAESSAATGRPTGRQAGRQAGLPAECTPALAGRLRQAGAQGDLASIEGVLLQLGVVPQTQRPSLRGPVAPPMQHTPAFTGVVMRTAATVLHGSDKVPFTTEYQPWGGEQPKPHACAPCHAL